MIQPYYLILKQNEIRFIGDGRAFEIRLLVLRLIEKTVDEDMKKSNY